MNKVLFYGIVSSSDLYEDYYDYNGIADSLKGKYRGLYEIGDYEQRQQDIEYSLEAAKDRIVKNLENDYESWLRWDKSRGIAYIPATYKVVSIHLEDEDD